MALTVPELGVGKGSTKDLIVAILTREWPLTARALSSRLQRQSETALSYQAVHKALMNLEQEGIVERFGNGYQLSLSWAGKLKDFSESVIESYRLDKNSDFKGSQILEFNTLFDFVRGILNIFSSTMLFEDGGPNSGGAF